MKTIHLVAVLSTSAYLSTLPAFASDLLETSRKSSEIRVFTEALERSGLAEYLKGPGPYTIFAPSNSAFGKLHDREKTELLKDKNKLAALLSYHILPAKVIVTEVKPGLAKTLQGSELQLKSDNGMISVNDARVTISDVEAENGVIHIIDTVLTPVE